MLVSLLFRQTNVVWVCFFFAWGIRNELMRLLDAEKPNHKETPAAELPSAFFDPVASKSHTRGDDACYLDSWKTLAHSFCSSPGFIRVTQGLLGLAAKNLLRLPLTLYSYVIPLGAFAAFVVWNQGIVLGDKDNHIATIHVPQVFYFISFTFVLTAVLTLHPQTFVRFGQMALSQATS